MGAQLNEYLIHVLERLRPLRLGREVLLVSITGPLGLRGLELGVHALQVRVDLLRTSIELLRPLVHLAVINFHADIRHK